MKNFINEIKLGLIKSNSIPTLPSKVENFHTHIFTRIFRFIGGICVILNLTKYYTLFPSFLPQIILIISIFHISYFMIILFIKIIFMSYNLIYKKELFEVRNSPLHLFATKIGKTLYCLKVGCYVSGATVGFIATRSW